MLSVYCKPNLATDNNLILWLISIKACPEGVSWVREIWLPNPPENLMQLIDALIDNQKYPWLLWLLEIAIKRLPKREYDGPEMLRLLAGFVEYIAMLEAHNVTQLNVYCVDAEREALDRAVTDLRYKISDHYAGSLIHRHYRQVITHFDKAVFCGCSVIEQA